MKFARCHPDRQHTAFGLCKMCYNKLTCQACWSPQNRLVRRLAKYYKMTPDRYQELYDAGCWLCGKPFDKNAKRTPHVDHDHTCCPGVTTCGKCIRGLAHQHCNQIITREDPSLLRKIADSLEKYLCRNEVTS